MQTLFLIATAFLLVTTHSLRSLAFRCSESHLSPVERSKSSVEVKAAPEISEQELHREFSALLADHGNTLSGRGYAGTRIANTPRANEIALEYGFFWWGLRVVMVPSKEAMVAHRLQIQKYYLEQQKNPDMEPAMVPLYVVGHEAQMGYEVVKDGKPAQINPEKLQEVLNSGVYEVDGLGNITQVNPESVKKYVSPDGFMAFHSSALPDAVGTNVWVKPAGWASPKQRGVHDFTAWKQTSEGQKLGAAVRKLLDQGYTFRFNHNPLAALNFLREKQVRSTRAQVKDASGQVIRDEKDNPLTARVETSNNSNRFGVFGTAYKSVLGRFQSGSAYSIEVYDPLGNLIGGEVGFFSKGHYIGDSVFYHDVRIARAAFYVFAEKLEGLGMRYSDAGMVSNYSRDNGAILMPSHDALRLLQGGPTEGILLSGVYDTRTTEHWTENFKSMVSKKGQALGVQSILSRLPALPEDAVQRAKVLELARDQKVSLKSVRLMIVPTLSAAREHAHSLAEGSTMPFYVITANKPNIFKDMNSNLRDLVNDTGTEASLQRSLAFFVKDVLEAQQIPEVVTFGAPKFADKEVPTDISAQVLAKALAVESLQNSAIQFSRENGHPVFELKAWGL